MVGDVPLLGPMHPGPMLQPRQHFSLPHLGGAPRGGAPGRPARTGRGGTSRYDPGSCAWGLTTGRGGTFPVPASTDLLSVSRYDPGGSRLAATGRGDTSSFSWGGALFLFPGEDLQAAAGRHVSCSWADLLPVYWYGLGL